MSEQGPVDDEFRRIAETLVGDAPGVRVFYVKAPGMQELVDQLAMVLSEQMADGDELHVTYNAMQAGWTEHPEQRGSFRRQAQPAWTELHMEYSAFVVLRSKNGS